MEIGVYNGENAVSMIKAAFKNHPASQVEYFGFDFFNNYTKQDIVKKLEQLGCSVTLIQGNTIDTIPKAVETLPKMDLIFIDGGKSIEVAQSDWDGSSKLMHRDTAVFVHNVDFSGVNRMIQNVPIDRYLVDVFKADNEGRVAKIKKRKT